MHLWCWVELFPTTLGSSHAVHWNGEASLYWSVKALQRSSQSSWPWCNVKCMGVRHRERERQFQDTHLERISYFHGSRGHVIKTAAHSCLDAFFAHIYLPAQIAEENRSDVYICVHMSVKYSNNNSVTAAVVYNVNFFFLLLLYKHFMSTCSCKLFWLESSVLSTSKDVNDTR